MGTHKRTSFIPQDTDEEFGFQIASMADVLMILLLFFVATAQTEVTLQTADLRLPEAKEAKPPEGQERRMTIHIEKFTHYIKIETNPKVYMKTDDIVPEILSRRVAAERLAKQVGGEKESFRVLIRADKFTPYSKIKEVLKACSEAGVIDVIFVTESGESEQEKP
jgi:biopolymer transport protein ExbD